MARISPADAAAKWGRAMQGASQNYSDGIMRVDQAPGAAAARNQAGYVNGVQAAAASGKWAANVGRVSLQDWQQAAVQKGASRLASGASQAIPKVQAAHERIAPMLDRAAQAISSLPRSTPEERMNRAMVHMRTMHEAANGASRGRR